MVPRKAKSKGNWLQICQVSTARWLPGTVCDKCCASLAFNPPPPPALADSSHRVPALRYYTDQLDAAFLKISGSEEDEFHFEDFRGVCSELGLERP